jgi:hypothetical protein
VVCTSTSSKNPWTGRPDETKNLQHRHVSVVTDGAVTDAAGKPKTAKLTAAEKLAR